MNTKKSLAGRKRQLGISAVISLALLIVCVLWLVFDLYGFQVIRAKSPDLEFVSKGIVLGLIPKLLVYLPLAVSLFIIIKTFKELKLLSFACIILGIISFMAIAVDIAALNDIGDDYIEGGNRCIMEWSTLYAGLVFHFLFYTSAIMIIYRSLKISKSMEKLEITIVDETLFEITQLAGILCGSIGIVFTLYMYFIMGHAEIPKNNWLIWLSFGYCVVFLIPYLSINLYWIFRLILSKNRSVYDEKQKHDLFRAGWTAWITSMPVMLIFVIINAGKANFASSVLWFPLYMFVTLFVFSSSTLIYFKKDK
jgi:hypothetical protein